MKLLKVDGGDLLLVEGGSLLLVEADEFDPANLQAVVDGSDVHLTWDPSPMVPAGDPTNANPVDPASASHTIPLSMDTADGDGNLSAVEPGDVVAIESGTRGPLTLRNFFGTAAQPIVFVNDGGVVDIDADGGVAGIHVEDCRHIRVTGSGAPGGAGRTVGSVPYVPGMNLDDLEVVQDAGIHIHSGQRGVRFKKHDWLFGLDPGVYDLGFEFDHWEIGPQSKNGFHGPEDSTDAGPDYTVAGLRIHHCWIHDTDQPPHFDGEGIYLGPSPSGWQTTIFIGDLEIDHNFIRRTGRQCIQYGATWYGDNRIHHNVCDEPGRQLLEDPEATTQAMTVININPGTRSWVYANYLFNAGRDGIRETGGLQGSRYFNNVIARGAVLQSSARGIRISTSRGDAPPEHIPPEDGALVYNNTIVSFDASGVHFTNAPDDGGNEARNNIFWNVPSGVTHGGSATSTASNNLSTDPAFVDAAGDDYRLQAGSDAVDAGFALAGFVDEDIQRIPRPQGSGWDIGAHERQP